MDSRMRLGVGWRKVDGICGCEDETRHLHSHNATIGNDHPGARATTIGTESVELSQQLETLGDFAKDDMSLV